MLTTASCASHQARAAAGVAEQKIAAVRIETLADSEIADIYQASGSVRARYSAAIAAKITANILELRVQTGDHVQAGQTLIVLDRRDLEANLLRSEAARAEAESAIEPRGIPLHDIHGPNLAAVKSRRLGNPAMPRACGRRSRHARTSRTGALARGAGRSSQSGCVWQLIHQRGRLTSR